MQMRSFSKNNVVVGIVVVLAALTGACARSKSVGTLPGDSVSADGGITLSPPQLSTSPSEMREAREGLGPVESRLYPPELIMEHQSELGITDEQKKTLLAETQKGQSDMIRLQWELQGEKEKLVTLLTPDHVDEARVQAAAAQVMDRESKVKASHLGMLVRVKNVLTADQQKKLRDIRASAQPTQLAPLPPAPPPTPSGPRNEGPRPAQPSPPKPPPRPHPNPNESPGY